MKKACRARVVRIVCITYVTDPTGNTRITIKFVICITGHAFSGVAISGTVRARGGGAVGAGAGIIDATGVGFVGVLTTPTGLAGGIVGRVAIAVRPRALRAGCAGAGAAPVARRAAAGVLTGGGFTNTVAAVSSCGPTSQAVAGRALVDV